MKAPSFALVAALSAWQCAATDKLTPKKLAADIKTEELQRVLWNLNKIANDNGGNRAFGYPGFKASMDFVLERAQDRFGKEFDTYIQPFTTEFENTNDIWVKGPEGEDVFVISMLYSPATPIPDGITAPLIDTPVNDERGSMCLPEDWEGIDATGKIVLVKRGTCAIYEKLVGARAAGAIGALLYNQEPGTNYSRATITAEYRDRVVPVGIIPLEVGLDFSSQLAAGKDLEVSLLVDSTLEDRETWNIISETKEGDPDNVIMLGAHLDSVPAGPGVNDDGSGTAGLLEIMGAIKKYKGFKNKVRFGWWGAEEVGLRGSLYYTNSLPEEELDKIRYYFNYDMIGSPTPVYSVFDGEEIGSKTLYDFLTEGGKPAQYGAFGSSSDYVGFLQKGIPSSGLFTGASPEQDPCYHQACDTTDNIDYDAITINTKAAAYAAATLALSLDGIPQRNTTAATSTPDRRRDFKAWDAVVAGAAHAKPCSHGVSLLV